LSLVKWIRLDAQLKRTHQSQPQSAASRPVGWLTPARGCAIGLLWGAFMLALCLVAGSLAVRGEFALRRGQPTELRVWLIRNEVNRGLGFSYSREVDRGQGEGNRCYLTRVRFLLWRSDGSAPGGEYCQCYGRTETGWVELGACLQVEGE
jgi:hypothetical protein